VHVSRDVVFEEDRPWKWRCEECGAWIDDMEPFTIEHVTMRGEPAVVSGLTPVAPSRAPSVHGEESPAHAPTLNIRRSPMTPDLVEFMSPSTCTPDLDNRADNVPRHFCTMWNILGQNPMSAPTDRGIVEDLLAAIGEEPATIEEALKVDEWHTARKEEIASIEENRTWSMVNLPKGNWAIGLR
jgi:hypothetical protein